MLFTISSNSPLHWIKIRISVISSSMLSPLVSLIHFKQAQPLWTAQLDESCSRTTSPSAFLQHGNWLPSKTPAPHHSQILPTFFAGIQFPMKLVIITKRVTLDLSSQSCLDLIGIIITIPVKRNICKFYFILDPPNKAESEFGTISKMIKFISKQL